MEQVSIYIHIPFCTKRCSYCDFNTYAGFNHLITDYMKALDQEAKIVAGHVDKTDQIHTIFFGGGTPSLISIEFLSGILNTLHSCYTVQPDVEITLEANPGSVNQDYLYKLKDLGFTRISFGMQSANGEDLKVLERQHGFEQVVQSVAWAKKAGFQQINLDLIFGIPSQKLSSWKDTLNEATNLEVDHLSLYSLTIEKGTPLEFAIAQGKIMAPDIDVAASMYEYAIDHLPGQGFTQYEISNWSTTIGNRSRHNLQYWLTKPYLGFGAGAHGYYNHQRMENKTGILDYIQSLHPENRKPNQFSPAGLQLTHLQAWDEMQEYLMLGFRLTEEGVSKASFEARFHHDLEMLFAKQLKLLLRSGLIESHPKDSDRLRLTDRGILFGNRVFSEFVGNIEPAGLKISAQ